MKRITKHQNNEIRHMLDAGISDRKIADAVGVSRESVRYRRLGKRRNTPRRPKRPPHYCHRHRTTTPGSCVACAALAKRDEGRHRPLPESWATGCESSLSTEMADELEELKQKSLDVKRNGTEGE